LRIAGALYLLLAAAPVLAQNSFVEITEDTLNRLVEGLRNPSDAGRYSPTVVNVIGGFEICEPFGYLDCPGAGGLGFEARLPLARCKTRGGWRVVSSGPQISWAWWVLDARFHLVEGAMRFSATVKSRVGKKWATKSNTVSASIGFDAPTNRLQINLTTFKVPLEYVLANMPHRVTEVDVARLYGLSVAIQPQQLRVPLPNGTTRTLTAKAVSVTPQYQEGRVRVAVDVGFN
jgi:hypothetical protein